jgi:hypothetical protein
VLQAFLELPEQDTKCNLPIQRSNHDLLNIYKGKQRSEEDEEEYVTEKDNIKQFEMTVLGDKESGPQSSGYSVVLHDIRVGRTDTMPKDSDKMDDSHYSMVDTREETKVPMNTFYFPEYP